MLSISLSGIKKIEEVASQSGYVSLSQGSIKCGGIPREIKAYIQTLLGTDKTDYYQSCWGIYALREKLQETLNQQYKTSFSFNQILPTHGCIGGLSLLYLTLLQAGDEVIIPEPSYPAYTSLTLATHTKAVHVSCYKPLEDADKPDFTWELNVEAIKQATTPKTKMIIFSNPWNPLGIIVPEETIKALIKWCEEKNIYLVIDEAYRDYVFAPGFRSALNYVNQSDWVISANTFSKNMAMSGWRIGYLVLPARLSAPLAGMQDTLLNCLNNVGQYAALYALEHPELVKKFYAIIKNNLATTIKQLHPLVSRGIISYTIPEAGFFLFLKTMQTDTNDLVLNILNNAKVGIIPGGTFGPSSKPFLRICYAREPEILHEGLRRFVGYFF